MGLGFSPMGSRLRALFFKFLRMALSGLVFAGLGFVLQGRYIASMVLDIVMITACL